MPSLVDLEGLTSDKLMEAVDTWPKSRVNILEQTRTLLSVRFAATSREIARLADWFARLETVGTGSYGTVYKGCVRAWDTTDMTPLTPPTCVQYTLPDLGATVAVAHSNHDIFLIIKTLTPLSKATLHDVPYSGHNSDFSAWLGQNNSVREVMMGRLLNLLVVRGVTPHFPLIYEPFHVVEGNRSAFAMELAHMSFANFMSSKILSTLDSGEAIEVLDVALLQICNGLLCAHKHFDFRHNDFHAENAMMTFITDTNYNYKVNGSYYKVPNYGMCWKLIDFGYSASPVFGENDLAHAAMHSPALSVANDYFDLTDHAEEFYDLLRLVTSAKYFARTLPVADRNLVYRRLDSYEETMRQIAIDSGDKRGSLGAARTAFIDNYYRGSVKLLEATPQLSALMRSSGLLERFFESLAAKYYVSSKPRGVLFDADISPFVGGDIVLEGIHTSPITVTEASVLAPPAISLHPATARATRPVARVSSATSTPRATPLPTPSPSP